MRTSSGVDPSDIEAPPPRSMFVRLFSTQDTSGYTSVTSLTILTSITNYAHRISHIASHQSLTNFPSLCTALYCAVHAACHWRVFESAVKPRIGSVTCLPPLGILALALSVSLARAVRYPLRVARGPAAPVAASSRVQLDRAAAGDARGMFRRHPDRKSLHTRCSRREHTST